ncbi:sulfite exporter TauE/SafE family protein [Salinisphaera sp. Q1T1-3]|uniref:sulfite exporter TauE/SafE family protein n=1 Tax=Salinisphaera sp. Q1T1-3 TaxID=2321229 RepID=UPI000E70B4B2|nr:sulfite exporter TauE/SafE family protein [Salinisphaera sp. Q1T1-3]RJS94109.1 sulfite exporter TauE/SafE family protein [Salinisphaera sp. Q1T1-3]
MQILIYNLAALLGATSQGLTGFGSGTLTISVLVLVYPFREVVPIVAVIGLTANVVMTLLAGREFDWRRGPIAALGMSIGMIIGAQLLAVLPVTVLQRGLGVVILCYVAINLFKTPAPKQVPRLSWLDASGLAGCSLFAGVIAGAVGVSPVPLLIYASLRYPKQEARAILTMGFLVSSAVQVLTYAHLGLLDAHAGWLAAASLPAVIIGAYLGHRLHYRIDQKTFARALAIILIAPAVRLVFFT